MRGARAALLAVALAVALLGLGLTRALTRAVPAEDFALKQAAAEHMRRCMDAVLSYRRELGIPPLPEDARGTGMLGDHFNAVTTTAGAADAKRTTADPNMAALMVGMLTEAGVGPGDRVGAGLSGSFPAMNLALICACEAIGAELIYIASVGASTYGANLPQLTFPDMALRLYADALIGTPPAAFSMGGASDVGLDMDAALSGEVRARLSASGVPFLDIRDFGANLRARMQLYAEGGPIDCFVGVGGGITTNGTGPSAPPHGILRAGDVGATGDRSGLIEIYAAAGVPAVHVIDIRKLVADYGMPYDPETPPAIGEGAPYMRTEYSKIPAACALAVDAALLICGHRRGRRVRR
ncbi:MAG: poly-gamma-glutamate system protein [Clostridiales bacterium]|nr:poly-gamma-glutamate system protein [Clostridiales bacterium]